jgi:hypothetical protein
MISLSILRMLALAIAGILVAAAVAWLASDLASRQIGLASEPISAGDDLAPALVRPHHDHRADRSSHGKGKTTTPAIPEGSPSSPVAEPPPPTAEPPPVTTEPPVTEPPGGSDSGGGEGGGGDD